MSAATVHHSPAGSRPEIPVNPCHAPGQPPLVWVLLATAVGVVVDRGVSPPPLLWVNVLGLLLWTHGVLYRRKRDRLGAVVLLAGVATLGGLWHHDRWNLFPPTELALRSGSAAFPLVARVTALDAPRHSPAAPAGALSTMTREAASRLPARVTAVRDASRWRVATGRVELLVQGGIEDVWRGDQLELVAMVIPVRRTRNPGEPDHWRVCRGRRQGATLLCAQPESVRVVRRGGCLSLMRQLGRLRISAEKSLDRYVGSRHGPLAAALLLGTRERLSDDTVQTFLVSGTLHLLAISGLHVGILAAGFWLLDRLQWLPRRWVLTLSCVLAVGYALLTGARPPVVRATILILVHCLARVIGLYPRPWNALAAAGLAALAWRPASLFETGTQLSFLAVATLIAAWPVLARRPAAEPLAQLVADSRPAWQQVLLAIRRRGQQLLAASCTVWLVTLPLVALRFHLVSFSAIVLNVLLWLPVTGALFSALLTVITAPLPLLPKLFGWVCGMSLLSIEQLVSFAQAGSWGYRWVVGPPWWWVLLFYTGLACRQAAPRMLSNRWWCGLLCGLVACGVATGSGATRAWRQTVQQPLRMSFVAVGHGSCVLVELPDGRALLYDAGRMGDARAAALPIASVLWSRRIRHLDAVILSHADADHFNALPDLLDRFSVGVVYVSPVMFREPVPGLQALHAALDRADVPLGLLHEGLRLAGGPVTMEILHPPREGFGREGDSDNVNSIVLQCTYGSHRMQLTGDLEGAGLEELLAELPVPCHLLMAPHHGSRHSQPEELVRWARPRVVVISAGGNLAIEQAEAAYSYGGATVYWTDRDGRVEVKSDGQRWWVATWRSGQDTRR